MATEQNIQEHIEVIRNETQKHGNTRQRVADVLTELNNSKVDKLELESELSQMSDTFNFDLSKKLDKPTASGAYIVLKNPSTGAVEYSAIALTSGYMPFWISNSFQQSDLYFNGTNFGFGKTDPSEKIDVIGRIRANGLRLNNSTSSSIPGEIKFKNNIFYATGNDGLEKRILREGDLHTHSVSDIIGLQSSLDLFDISITNLQNNKADLIGGKVPSSQLPSYVDDVLEFANLASFPTTGESGKIYIAIDTNVTYRWTGTGYAEISASLALGETASTAYRGDRGKISYDHSQTTGNPHGTTKGDIGLGNVDNTSDANKPISTATQTALNGKENIISVGTASQYFRGDKTWQTLNSSAVGLGNVPNVDATNPANITQSASYRFVTDIEKTNWNGKVSSQWTTSGSNIYYNGGNVGIGTTSPSYKLTVRNDVAASTSLDQASIGLYNNSDGGSAIYFSNAVGGQSKLSFGVESTGAGSDDTYLGFSTGANTSLSEHMRITSGGNVGIGITSPAYKFDLISNTGGISFRTYTSTTNYSEHTYSKDVGFFIDSYQSVGGAPYTKTTDLIANADAGADSQLRLFTTTTGGNPTERMRITSSGNVGIGTVSPQSRLEIKGSNVYDSVKSITLTHAEPTYYSGFIGLRQEGLPYTNLTFGTRSGGVDYLETLNIGNGNVGIGTTTPGFASTGRTVLSLNGSIDSFMEFQAGGNFKSYIYQSGDSFEIYDTIKLIFSVNGAERMIINSSGNVGIGTTSPSARLDVNGNMIVGAGNKSIGGWPFYISDPSNLGWKVSDSSGTAKFELYVGNSGINQMRLLGGVSIVGFNQDLSLGTSDYLNTLNISNTNGNVGIGTTSPSEALHVNGNLLVQLSNSMTTRNVAQIKQLGDSGVTGARNWALRGVYQYDSGIFGNAEGGDLDLIKSWNGNTILATKTDGSPLGNVGIGTTSPLQRLHVEGSSYFAADLFTYTLGGIFFSGNVNYSSGIYSRNAGNDLVLQAGSFERMRITSSGNVGIGTTSPSFRLTVSGGYTSFTNGTINILAGPDGTGGLIGTQTNHYLRFITNDEERMRITSSGNVGIGTTSPSTLLDVNHYATFLSTNGNRLKIWDGTDNIPTISADNLLVLDSPNIQFYATDVTDSNNNSIYLKLKTITGNTTLDNTYHNKIVRITASCIITIPNNLRTDFNCTFEVIGAYTAQFVDGSGATTSAPFGRYLKTDLTAMFYCTGTASNYRLNGSLATS